MTSPWLESQRAGRAHHARLACKLATAALYADVGDRAAILDNMRAHATERDRLDRLINRETFRLACEGRAPMPGVIYQ